MTFATLPVAPPAPEPGALQQAAVRAVAYADLFDYPLTASEVHRYLHGVDASPHATTACLEATAAEGILRHTDAFYTLKGRERLVEVRQQRTAHSEHLWNVAQQYGRLIGELPFVRMVAVTGSLAWSNSHGQDDIDYLIVCEPGRLWLCRVAVRLMVRFAQRRGVHLCPNYFLSGRALTLPERTLYTAYELAQTRPVAGFSTFERMCRLNSWAAGFLPNAFRRPHGAAEDTRRVGAPARALRVVGWCAEAVLRTPIGTALEWVEMRHRIRKIRANWTGRDAWIEAAYDADRCKAHTKPHGKRILARFAARLDDLGVRVG